MKDVVRKKIGPFLRKEKNVVPVKRKSSLIKNSTLIVPTSDTIEFIRVEDILYLKSEGNYCYLFLKNNEKLLVSKTLKYFSDILVDYNYLRVHQSYFVNVKAIKRYNKNRCGSLLLRDGTVIPVSRSCKKSITDYVTV